LHAVRYRSIIIQPLNYTSNALVLLQELQGYLVLMSMTIDEIQLGFYLAIFIHTGSGIGLTYEFLTVTLQWFALQFRIYKQPAIPIGFYLVLSRLSKLSRFEHYRNVLHVKGLVIKGIAGTVL
jgi:hypothetical protein